MRAIRRLRSAREAEVAFHVVIVVLLGRGLRLGCIPTCIGNDRLISLPLALDQVGKLAIDFAFEQGLEIILDRRLVGRKIRNVEVADISGHLIDGRDGALVEDKVSAFGCRGIGHLGFRQFRRLGRFSSLSDVRYLGFLPGDIFLDLRLQRSEPVVIIELVGRSRLSERNRCSTSGNGGNRLDRLLREESIEIGIAELRFCRFRHGSCRHLISRALRLLIRRCVLGFIEEARECSRHIILDSGLTTKIGRRLIGRNFRCDGRFLRCKGIVEGDDLLRRGFHGFRNILLDVIDRIEIIEREIEIFLGEEILGLVVEILLDLGIILDNKRRLFHGRFNGHLAGFKLGAVFIQLGGELSLERIEVHRIRRDLFQRSFVLGQETLDSRCELRRIDECRLMGAVGLDLAGCIIAMMRLCIPMGRQVEAGYLGKNVVDILRTFLLGCLF